MHLQDQRVLITGAGGGIGRALLRELAARGARLCALEHSPAAAETLLDEIKPLGIDLLLAYGELTQDETREAALALVERTWGGLDLLVNLAGVLDFVRYQDQDPGLISRLIKVNVVAPMLLTRAVLPGMIAQGHGRIVNVGSMFGSIGFPLFAAYSASKFALRGFSQALRRELAGTGVGVTYVSPRAVKTPLNPPVIHAMAERGLMHMDAPGPVAQAIVRAIERDRREAYLGMPEGIFARINGVMPGLVDRALATQVPTLSTYATRGKPVET
jgi:NAD(P)-dependent dehydrogenase (short-subunit alcohol dehydrogenase family)